MDPEQSLIIKDEYEEITIEDNVICKAEETPTINCEICSWPYNSVFNLTTHMEENHPDVSHKCNDCAETSPMKLLHLIHRRNTHNEFDMKTNDGYECKICSEQFESVKLLNKHLTSHSIYSCDVCGFYATHQDDVDNTMKHLKPHGRLKKIKFNCSGCDFQTKVCKRMRLHVCPDVLFPCESCEETFKNASLLKQHVSLTHANKYKCEFCDRVIRQRHNLNKHMRRFHPTRFSKCVECNLKFALKHFLLIHRRNKHAEFDVRNSDDRFECKLCPDKFDDLEELNGHMETHSVYTCGVCYFYAQSKDLLSKHVQHLNTTLDNPYECNKCDYKTEQYQAFTKHVCQYCCDLCDEFFLYESSLKLHLGLYHKASDFRCERCLMYLTSEIALNKHRISCKSPVKLQCKLCDYSNINDSMLVEHIVNKHDGVKTSLQEIR